MNVDRSLARKLLLVTALALTGWAVWQVGRDEVVDAKAFRAGRGAGVAPRMALDLRRGAGEPLVAAEPIRLPQRADPADSVLDFFAPLAPSRPMVVVAPKPANPAPVAPALPFSYIGRIEEGGQTRIFMMNGDKALVAVAGEPLSGGWRLASVAAAQLEFIYEPLNQQVILRIGAN